MAQLPEAVIEIAGVLLAVLLAVAAHALVQRRLKPELLRRHNDVAGYLFSAVGVIYAVLLGFVVVVVWEKYDATVANVSTEVAAVSDLYRSVGGFAQPARGAIRRDLREYAHNVIYVEWPAMAHPSTQTKDLRLLERIAYRVDTYQARTLSQSNAQQMAMTQRARLFDARRERFYQAAPSVPVVLWAALVLGALAMLSFTYLFGVENQPAQLVMTAILAGLIAVLFIVIAEFDQPFAGSVRISPNVWIAIAHHLPHIP